MWRQAGIDVEKGSTFIYAIATYVVVTKYSRWG